MQFHFVNFSTTKNTCTNTNRVFCVNFDADIKWEVGKAKFKCIKNVYFTIDYAGVLLCKHNFVMMWLMQLCKK